MYNFFPLKVDNDKIRDFHDSEESLLHNAYNEITYNNKSIINIINIVSIDLIFKDYITYFLQNHGNPSYIDNKDDEYPSYIGNKDDAYHKLIEELLKLRFNKDYKIIKGNNKINILLIKIIWIESNANYILSIIKIFERQTYI